MATKPPAKRRNPLAPEEPAPSLPEMAFNLDDVTGHYPIGLLNQQIGTGQHSDNPFEPDDASPVTLHHAQTEPITDERNTNPPTARLEPESEPAQVRAEPESPLTPGVMITLALVIGSVLALALVAFIVVVMALT